MTLPERRFMRETDTKIDANPCELSERELSEYRRLLLLNLAEALAASTRRDMLVAKYGTQPAATGK